MSELVANRGRNVTQPRHLGRETLIDVPTDMGSRSIISRRPLLRAGTKGRRGGEQDATGEEDDETGLGDPSNSADKRANKFVRLNRNRTRETKSQLYPASPNDVFVPKLSHKKWEMRMMERTRWMISR